MVLIKHVVLLSPVEQRLSILHVDAELLGQFSQSDQRLLINVESWVGGPATDRLKSFL